MHQPASTRDHERQRAGCRSGPARRPPPIPTPPAERGTFWYHSANAATTQTNRGLCGVLVVRDPRGAAFDRERVLLIHDPELNRRGQLAPPEKLFRDKREVLLVNGVPEPEMQIATGQVERWRLINTTNARHLRLSLGGDRFHLIRTNGPTPPAADELHAHESR